MITIPQGASKELTTHLEDDDGNIIDLTASPPQNVMLELVHESRKKRLNLYGTNATIMNQSGLPYQDAYIVGNDIIFYVDGANTADWPPGRILAKFTITYVNTDFPVSGVQTIKGQGVMFDIIN